jgi:glycosyltransferase 2 family protein
VGPVRDGRAPIGRGETIALIVGVALLTVSWAIAATARVPEWEARLFTTINDWPDVIWSVVVVPMQLGSFGGALVVTAATALLTRDRRLTLAVLIASQAAWWSAKAVKALVDRGRPEALLPHVHVREHVSGLGYPSGHAAVAFALAAALSPSLPPRFRPLAWIMAGVVAFARVHAGAHLPLDVIGGAGLGLIVGTVTRRACGLVAFTSGSGAPASGS